MNIMSAIIDKQDTEVCVHRMKSNELRPTGKEWGLLFPMYAPFLHKYNFDILYIYLLLLIVYGSTSVLYSDFK